MGFIFDAQFSSQSKWGSSEYETFTPRDHLAAIMEFGTVKKKMRCGTVFWAMNQLRTKNRATSSIPVK